MAKAKVKKIRPKTPLDTNLSEMSTIQALTNASLYMDSFLCQKYPDLAPNPAFLERGLKGTADYNVWRAFMCIEIALENEGY